MRMDSARLRARLYKHREKSVTSSTKLHLGCGKRLVPGWLNVDVAGDGVLVDLATVPLPWQDGVFNVIVSQHVIEHLEFMEEVIPLLRELRRTAKAGAEIWLSCPDLEKTCRSYLENHGADMLEDFITRFPDLKAWRAIPAHMINSLFHQQGEHKNLYDYAMLKWACDQTGWANCTHVVEADLLKRFPDFPARNDDFHSIYITATAGS
jgi:predicted SAM-dependent methyltransferase